MKRIIAVAGSVLVMAGLAVGSTVVASTTVATGVGSATGTIEGGRVGGPMTTFDARLLDTREGQATADGLFTGTGPLADRQPLVVDVRERFILDDEVSTLLVNVVATEGIGPGFVTVYDCAAGPPETSNLNFTAGQTIANSALVDFTGDSICLLSNTTVDVIVDLVGTFDFRAGPPRRVVDTRIDFNDTILKDEPIELQPGVPFDLSFRDIPNSDAVLNVVATNAAEAGWLSFDVCPDQSVDADRQRTSAINFGPGATVANLVVVGGSTCITTSTDVYVVIDDVASPPAVPDLFFDLDKWPAGSWFPGEGQRLLDTRTAIDAFGSAVSRPLAGSVTQAFSRRGLVGQSRVAIVNITAVFPDDDGFVTAYGCADKDEAKPVTSSMNYTAGDVVAHTTFVPLGPDEDVCLFTKAATDIVVDDMGEVDADIGLTLRFEDPSGCGFVEELSTDGTIDPGWVSTTNAAQGFALAGNLRLKIVGGSSSYDVEAQGDDDWTFEIIDEPNADVDITWSATSAVAGSYPLVVTVTDSEGTSIEATTSVRVNPTKTIPC